MTDREETIKSLKNLYIQIGRGAGKNSLCLALMNALRLLKEQPDVVRCKDCKLWHDSIKCPLYSNGIETSKNWFCAAGERVK